VAERTKRTIEVWDRCECGRVLHSISEGERGTCATCWFKAMPQSTKTALNRLIACAFDGSPGGQKDTAIQAAFAALKAKE
jgi:hypothetical protein